MTKETVSAHYLSLLMCYFSLLRKIVRGHIRIKPGRFLIAVSKWVSINIIYQPVHVYYDFLEFLSTCSFVSAESDDLPAVTRTTRRDVLSLTPAEGVNI